MGDLLKYILYEVVNTLVGEAEFLHYLSGLSLHFADNIVSNFGALIATGENARVGISPEFSDSFAANLGERRRAFVVIVIGDKSLPDLSELLI